MSLTRLTILTIGPFVVIATAWWLSAPQTFAGISRVPRMSSPESSTPPGGTGTQSLAENCRSTASRLQEALPQGFTVLVRPPFVIAGDVPKSRLQGMHADVIAPVSRALQATYFKHAPRQPIIIVVCSTEDLFRQLARDWDGHLETGYHGYYQRDKRRILLDLEAGNGSLAHELTHALSHADCDRLPEWFDEGLGALHEEATYSSDGRHLLGLPNWRCKLSRQAARSGTIPALDTWTSSTSFRSDDVGLRYALARSMCLFLQEQHVLTEYYHELRDRPESDPEGLGALCRVLGARNLTQADRQFACWIISQRNR